MRGLGVRAGRAASPTQHMCLKQSDVVPLHGGIGFSCCCIPACDIIISQGIPAIIIGATYSAERASRDDVLLTKASAMSTSRSWRSLWNMDLNRSIQAERGNG